MATIRDDMVGGLQNLLTEQAALPGMLSVDVVTFDDVVELTHLMADPKDVVVELVPRGSTALYDAVGIAIRGFGQALAVLPEHARPGTVQVVIVTDGYENASREYTSDAVRALITQQTEKYAWDFMFLGANQDAVLTAGALGIDADSAMTYAAAPEAVGSASESASRYVSDLRRGSKKGFSSAERIAAAPPTGSR